MVKTKKKEKQVVPNIIVNVTNANTQSSTNDRQFNNGREIVERNWTTAMILSVLLGWIGVDRFYAGHYGLGLLKLFTLSCYGIWWIIDIIMFATKNVRYVKWV